MNEKEKDTIEVSKEERDGYEKYEEKHVEHVNEGEDKKLRGPYAKYLIAGVILFCMIGIFYLILGSGDHKKSANNTPELKAQLSEELYQRKNVTLDDIDAITRLKRKNSRGNLHASDSKHYRKGQYVENGDDFSLPKARSSTDLDTPINIFSDPRYAVVGNYKSSSIGTSINIPTGTILHSYLKREVSTLQKDVPVVGIIYYTASHSKPRYIPEGCKLIGRISGVSGERVLIDFRGGILPDGSNFRLSGVALGDDYGSRYEGITGIVDRKINRRGGGILANSALRATRTLTSITGNSFGSIFAGEVADQTMDEMEDGVDNNMDNYTGPEIILPANTRFLVVVR